MRGMICFGIGALGVFLMCDAQPASAQAGPCRDPWVSQAVREVAGREAIGSGETGECNIQLYGARWGSYAELKGYVAQARAALAEAGLEYVDGGRNMYDRTFSRKIAGNAYAGPPANKPNVYNWTISLPSGNVMVIYRRCSKGRTPAGGPQSYGCV